MIDARESIRLIWRSGHDGADLARRLGVDRHSFPPPPVEGTGGSLVVASARPFSFVRSFARSLATMRKASIPSRVTTISVCAPVESDRSPRAWNETSLLTVQNVPGAKS